ncbi:hypothetical protein FRC00_000886 [Tulasnella sp. 408]|nr:hypothetical protein FRC00_000886 [Tulasnella sp. 408]
MRSTTPFICIVALALAARDIAAQDNPTTTSTANDANITTAKECITTSRAPEQEAAVTGFQAELCSSVGRSTQPIRASASSTISSTTSSLEDPAEPTFNNGVETWGVPSSITVPYTSTAPATVSAVRSGNATVSDNAAVSVNTVALWQPLFGLIGEPSSLSMSYTVTTTAIASATASTTATSTGSGNAAVSVKMLALC